MSGFYLACCKMASFLLDRRTEETEREERLGKRGRQDVGMLFHLASGSGDRLSGWTLSLQLPRCLSV